MADPFAHHPELRPLIIPPEDSPLRGFTPQKVIARLAENGLPTEWIDSTEVREACRRDALNGYEGDLWIFGYGSLMWNPALHFAEVRRAHAPGHARRFILRDINGARGTPDRPGLMAALDEGAGCDGLAFRIAAEDVEAETFRLWERERIASAYFPRFIRIILDDGEVSALTFVANHDAANIHPDLSRDEQIRLFATGEGFLGTSLEYLENIAQHFETLGIVDPEVIDLLEEVHAQCV